MSLHVAGVDDFRGFIRDLPERGHALASGKNHPAARRACGAGHQSAAIKTAGPNHEPGAARPMIGQRYT